MSRRPRLFVPGGFYHVTARGNHQQPLFRDVVDYWALEHIVATALEPARARLHAYCWMTNHIHLLVEVSDLPLGVLMHRIATRFSRAAQKRVPTTGHYFERRYHAVLVDVDEYFLVLLRYIHMNSVSAGIVTDPDLYRWSSHDIYAGRRQVPWVTTDFGLALFSPRVVEARALYRRYVSVATPAGEPVANSQDPRVLGGLPTGESCTARVIHSERPSLDAIAAEICAEHGIVLAELVSSRRRSDLNRAREAFVARAMCEGVASQHQVATFLNRSAAAISRAAARGQRAEPRQGPPE
jgi:putative transposase